MRLFLDSSVLLAAAGSLSGGSAAVIQLASARAWTLIANEYVFDEVEANIVDMSPEAAARWASIRPKIAQLETRFAPHRITVFPVAKDRPVLFTAADVADVLLTLDRRDFLNRLGSRFYDLSIQTPRSFLRSFGEPAT